MKILEVCLFSAGADGVWQRVKSEAELLAEKNEVMVFSSNLTKGSDKIAPQEEKIGRVRVRRFNAKKLGGESFMFFDFEKDALKFEPDLIIAHVYRHNHTWQSLRVARRLRQKGKKTKIFLVTHAPFGRELSRSKLQNIVVLFYDLLLGSIILNKFDKIIRISNWEVPYLKKIGANEKKIIYLPNGISSEYFKKSKKTSMKQDLLYTGRISQIKNIETMILAAKKVNSGIKIKILGPAEMEYLQKLKEIIKEQNLEKQIRMENRTFERKEQIKNLDESEIFVLPSISEGHPQSLIEAMSRGKIVIASNNLAAKDIITHGQNGFLFETGNSEDLAIKVKKALALNKNERDLIQKKAIETARKFEWKNLINKLLGQI